MPVRPGTDVLASFGVAHAELRLMSGGQGETWSAADVVLKPVGSVAEAEWVGTVLCDLPAQGFRVSRPVQSVAGSWTAGGWSAWRWVDGRHDFANRWVDVLAVGTSFHDALREVPRPGFIDGRSDVWTEGDRAAWDDTLPEVIHAELRPLVEQFAALRRPTRLPSQVVHGDLTGNVLFADPADPAVIDFVPYWRPAEFALAIVVADAIAWHQAGPELVQRLPVVEDPLSMLARAAIFRLIAADRAATCRAGDKLTYLQGNVEAHARVLAALG
jgi:uncharacterized protein (TIGR02569 family)